MAIMSSRLIRHEICKDELKKLGARVIDIQGVMSLVKFQIEGTKITYIFHLNDDNTFYLERIKPYSMPIGDYTTEEEIVDVITVDMEQFQNAMLSKNFSKFIEIDYNIAKLVRLFEDLYLYYNIKKDDLGVLDTEIHTLLDIIRRIKTDSERVYFKKEPDVLETDLEYETPTLNE
jgi:SNF2 family DNA or RNA helicase